MLHQSVIFNTSDADGITLAPVLNDKVLSVRVDLDLNWKEQNKEIKFRAEISLLDLEKMRNLTGIKTKSVISETT